MSRSLNLMTEDAVRRRITSEAIWLWFRVLLVASVLAGGVGVLKAWQREESRQQRIALTAQHQPIQQLRNDLVLLKARINSVQERERLALGIHGAPPVLSVLAGVAEAAKAFRGEAYLDNVAYDAGGPMAPDSEPRRVAIEGLARDATAIQRFVTALRESGCFREVQIDTTEPRLLRGTATTAFEVECVL